MPEAYELPGHNYGLRHGSPGIPFLKKNTGEFAQQEMLLRLLRQTNEIDLLSLTSVEWGWDSDVPIDKNEQWQFWRAGYVHCPAPYCLLVGVINVNWLVTADAEYKIIDTALVAASKSVYDERIKRYRIKSDLDSTFGWGGYARYPLDFAGTGLFCSQYTRHIPVPVDGERGASRVFMRQVMPGGRILSKELSGWPECVASNPIEPLPAPSDDR